MEAALRKEGIEYVWMGDTLGNPKDSKGKRTLEGFKAFQATPTYQSGLQKLRDLLKSAPGNVALTCAEGRECDCHRSMILEDLKNGD